VFGGQGLEFWSNLSKLITKSAAIETVMFVLFEFLNSRFAGLQSLLGIVEFLFELADFLSVLVSLIDNSLLL
jgi:hypothetical protein